jgi:hypothetical protein
MDELFSNDYPDGEESMFLNYFKEKPLIFAACMQEAVVKTEQALAITDKQKKDATFTNSALNY